MADAPERASSRGAESEQNRPYRRVVALVFTLSVAAICGLIFRGIVRHLDRMPAHERPGTVDTRALKACAEDLLRLEESVRKLAGRAFSEPNAAEPILDQFGELEEERSRIVARCTLDQPNDPASLELERASSKIEDSARSYRLLFHRHHDDGQAASREARAAIERARSILSKR
ncbi:MAG: hypothetical protein HYV07_30530 [Deltaproteobacteria bacterium]|nr:hypothetical protein [Deltaproteobacteria bacterium]